jgi:ADP-ribose pyrophosphatase YjhB (NUDIX family)
MIVFDREEWRFNFRVAAVCIHEGWVLLHRAATDDFWALPGGRVELGEPSADTLRREMREELDEDVTVGRLFWVVENFFTYDKQRFHELAFYYEVSLPDGSRWLERDREHLASDAGTQLIFRWFPIDPAALAAYRIVPDFLPAAFSRPPDNPFSYPIHIVHTDEP